MLPGAINAEKIATNNADASKHLSGTCSSSRNSSESTTNYSLKLSNFYHCKKKILWLVVGGVAGGLIVALIISVAAGALAANPRLTPTPESTLSPALQLSNKKTMLAPLPASGSSAKPLLKLMLNLTQVTTMPETNKTHHATELVPDDLNAYDLFGFSVVIGNGTLIIGTPCDAEKCDNSGSACICTRVGDKWSLQTKFVPNVGNAYDHFGGSVDVHGDTVIIGVSNDDDKGDNSGSAYTHSRVGDNWSLHTKLLPDDGNAHDYFGHSIAIDGDTITISAPRDNDKGDDSGSVYIYNILET